MNYLYFLVIFLIFISSYILVLKNFKFSLYVLIVLSVMLHKELFSFYRWNLMPARIFMLALLFAGITRTYLYVVKSGGIKSLLPFIKDPFILTLLIIFFTRALSLIFSKNLQASIFLLGFFATIVALGIYLYLTFRESPQELLKYLKFFIYVVFALTIFGYYQLFHFYQTEKVIGAMWPVPGKVPRVGSLFWDVNHYGALLSALTPLLLVFFVNAKNKKEKLLYVIMALSFSASLLLTNSRTAWMLAGFSAIFFVTILFIKKFGAKGILYIFLVLVLITTPFLVEYSKKKSNFRRYVRDAFHYRIDSFDSHFMLLTGAYQIFEKYPYLGGGYGSFFEHFSKTKIAPKFFTRDTAALSGRVPAHTIWGESLSETGIVGTVPFVSFLLFSFLSPLYVFFKSTDKKNAFIGGLMSSVIFGWYMAGIFYSYNSEFFWLLIFSYFIWGIGVIGKDWVKKIVQYIFANKSVMFSIIVILSALLIFTGLGKNHLIPWDEAIYAKVAKNMLINKQFVVPHWDSLTKGWFEKPPLYMWMMSGLMSFLGFNSWAARLPSALFGFLTVLLVYVFSKKFFNKTSAFISSLALVTTVHFLYYSRASMLDVTTTFFITLALYLYWKTKEKNKILLWILSGLSTGFAVMTKGFIGLLPLLIIAIYELILIFVYKEKLNRQKFCRYFLMFLSLCVIALPWHLVMYQKFGMSFINKYFLYHVWDRAVMEIEDKGNPFFWYITVMKVSMRIWFVALLGAFPFTVFKAFKKDKKNVFLLVWALSIFLFFSSAKSKLIWYIIPIYPVVSIMVGAFSEQLLDFVMKKIRIFNNVYFKFLALSFVLIFSLFYLFLNREKVYPSDLNGAPAYLLMKKDEIFGLERTVYLDRIDIPTALFYTDGPFVLTDVNVKEPDRVPEVSDDEPLIFVSKKGRYSERVPGYSKKSKIVKEYDPYYLWYVPSESGAFILELE